MCCGVSLLILSLAHAALHWFHGICLWDRLWQLSCSWSQNADILKTQHTRSNLPCVPLEHLSSCQPVLANQILLWAVAVEVWRFVCLMCLRNMRVCWSIALCFYTKHAHTLPLCLLTNNVQRCERQMAPNFSLLFYLYDFFCIKSKYRCQQEFCIRHNYVSNKILRSSL